MGAPSRTRAAVLFAVQEALRRGDCFVSCDEVLSRASSLLDLDRSEHLIRRPRIVRNENFDDRSGEACPAWVARHEITDGAGEDAKADDRARLKRPPEYYLLKPISVPQSIHRIHFKPGGNHVIGCTSRIGRASQGNDDSARLHRCRKDRQADPAINAAEDRGTLFILRVSLGKPRI